jgi:pimeloyl-ACP methyl ester carboxylesterase
MSVTITKNVRKCERTGMQIDVCWRMIEPVDKSKAGDAHLDLIVLVPGQGAGMFNYEDDFAQLLADRASARVVVVDNRDCGRGANCDALGAPPIAALLAPTWIAPASPPYTLAELSLDVLALVEKLLEAIDSAGKLDGRRRRVHLVGTSMGGMICQWAKILAPERVASLTCIFSSLGAGGSSPPLWVYWYLLRHGRPPTLPPSTATAAEREEILASVKLSMIGNVLLPASRSLAERERDVHAIRPRVIADIRHSGGAGQSAGAAARQLAAVFHSPPRAALLAAVLQREREQNGAHTAPSQVLVVGGNEDVLFPRDHFDAWITLGCVPKAQAESCMLLLEDAGHFLERRHYNRVSACIAAMVNALRQS